MAAPSQLVGQALGHYCIIEQIGAGGMGVVYRAQDEQLERDVAIKVLPVGTLAGEAARKRFRKEALALAKLNHPNIATIFEFSTHNSTDYLVTEYISGLTLEEKVAHGALSEKEVVGSGGKLIHQLRHIRCSSITTIGLVNGQCRTFLIQSHVPEEDLCRPLHLPKISCPPRQGAQCVGGSRVRLPSFTVWSCWKSSS